LGTTAADEDFLVVCAVLRNQSRVANSLFSGQIREIFSGCGEQKIVWLEKTLNFQCFNDVLGEFQGNTAETKQGIDLLRTGIRDQGGATEQGS
jgi:hypothetical protein